MSLILTALAGAVAKKAVDKVYDEVFGDDDNDDDDDEKCILYMGRKSCEKVDDAYENDGCMSKKLYKDLEVFDSYEELEEYVEDVLELDTDDIYMLGDGSCDEYYIQVK